MIVLFKFMFFKRCKNKVNKPNHYENKKSHQIMKCFLRSSDGIKPFYIFLTHFIMHPLAKSTKEFLNTNKKSIKRIISSGAAVRKIPNNVL